MTKVFIGGSRKAPRINEYVRNRIDKIIERRCTILIGDANGIDKSVQRYLFERNYRNVVVFCAGSECRNNLGHWETRHIGVNQKKKDSDYYAAKDLEMVRETDYGFLIWDSKSKGTKENILNLLRADKRTVVYLTSNKSFYILTRVSEVENLMNTCNTAYQHRFEDMSKIKVNAKTEEEEDSERVLDLA